MQLFDHKEYACYQTDMEPQSFHGTGDIWASVFTGCLVLGKSSDFAMKTACEFVREAIHLTLVEENHKWLPHHSQFSSAHSLFHYLTVQKKAPCKNQFGNESRYNSKFKQHMS